MLRAALSTPFRTDDAPGVVIIGTVLTLCSWAVVPIWLFSSLLAPVLLLLAPLALAPALVTRGYFLRVVREGVRDGNAAGAPSFVRWGTLYRDGVRSVCLTVWYLLPVIVLVGVAVAVGLLADANRIDTVLVEPAPVDIDPIADVTVGEGTSAGEGSLLSLLSGLFSGLVGAFTFGYLVVYVYLRPAALAVLADTGRLRDAIRPTRAFRVALSGEYAVAWLLALATLLGGYALATPFVPLLVGIAFVFLLRVAVHALLGRGAAAVLAAERDTGGSADPRASAAAPDVPHRHVTMPPATPDRGVAVQSGEATDGGGRPGESTGGDPVSSPPGIGHGRRSAAEASPDVQVGRTVRGPRVEPEAGRSTDQYDSGTAGLTGREPPDEEGSNGESEDEKGSNGEPEDEEQSNEGSPDRGSGGEEAAFEWGPPIEER